MTFDFAIAWNWDHDADFVADVARACEREGLSFQSIPASGLAEAVAAATRGERSWKVLLDRAWESDPAFEQLNRVAAAADTRILNPPDRAAAFGNKAAAHAALAGAGVPLPRQTDLMPQDWNALLLETETADWRRPLWLKPACAGGGDGVTPLPRLPHAFPLGPEWLGQRFILQESAAPLRLAGRPAYFRAFTVLGQVLVLWWDPATHRFTPLSPEDAREYALDCVPRAVAAVGRVAHMDLFSTEVSLRAPGEAAVIDPVNDPVDLRRQSRAADGIPDRVLAEIVEALVRGVRGIIRPPSLLTS